MTAMQAEHTLQDDELSEGVIDIFSGVWICDEHGTKMHAGRQCAFCAVEIHGMSVLEKLAILPD